MASKRSTTAPPAGNGMPKEKRSPSALLWTSQKSMRWPLRKSAARRSEPGAIRLDFAPSGAWIRLHFAERNHFMVSSQEIERRYRNIRAEMAAEKIDALVVCGNEYTGFEGAVRYVSDFEI